MSRKKHGFIEAAMRSSNIVILLSLVFMIIGIVALKKMPRNEFPPFTIRQGVIVGVYPGATSSEVEAQLTRVVENYIFSYSEVKKTRTYSQSKDGIMYIFVELNDDVKNADQFWSKMKHGLAEMKQTLPPGVIALIANSDFGDTSALLISLSSETKSYKDLEEELKKLEAECRKIPATSKIRHFGLQKEKIYVNVKPEMLNEYNIKSISLLGSYAMNGMVNYAGKLKDGQNELSVHFPSSFSSEEDLADQIVYNDPNGNVVRLKNIASIERRYQDPDNYIRENGRKTILLSLEMQQGNNIVEYGKEVDKAINKFRMHCPEGISISKVSELPKYVDESITNFMKEFFIAILAVILVTMLLLPFRVASVAGITVPIAVLITLSFLYFFGIELDTVSLAALIIVLGMIVDNSIVVIDNHVAKMDQGDSPWHAALISARELVAPIIVATLAIMIAYIPLAFMLPGTAGEFVKNLPIVICISLTVSVLVALLLVPFFNYVFIKTGLKKRENERKRRSFLQVLQGWFDRSLEKAFRYPRIVIGSGIAAILLGIFLFKIMDQQLFPELERNQFAVEIYLPTGASLERTAKVVDTLETLLMKDKRVTNVTSFTGTSSPRFHTVYAPNMPSSNYGQLLVNVVSNEAAVEVVRSYSQKYSDCFPGTHVKWKLLALQRFQAPIEIRISSDSIKDIKTVQKEVYDILNQTRDISWIRNDWNEQQQEIRVNMDRDKANRLGYSKGFGATSLMIGMEGMPLTTIWENDYPVEVRLTQESRGEKSIQTLGDQYITSPSSFSAIPLRSFATFTPEWNEGTIVRRNGTRTMTVLVDNDYNRVGSVIFDEIKPKLDKISLPEGTTITYGGEYDEQGEVFIPMGLALALSVAFIFFILLFEFRKSKIALLIMSTMLLGLPGAAIGLTVMGYPFSLTAFIGITSLCGMVVRNGIILIDYARELHENQGMHVKEAALAAGKRRMRPVFLTSAAASVGVIPMILSRSSLWGPLGTVICFGLLISMVLTLYILPVLYSMTYSDKARKIRRWSVPAATAILVLLFILPAKNTTAQTLSLDSCKKLALSNNLSIKSADLEIGASRQQKKNAFTHYFPVVQGSLLAMKSNDYLLKAEVPGLPVFNSTSPYPIGMTPTLPLNLIDYTNTGMIAAVMPVYAGGKIRNGNKLASLGEDVSRKQKDLTVTDVLVRTDELFWMIQTLEEKKKTVDSYQAYLDSLYRDVTNLEHAGMVQKNDLMKVKLKQNELKTGKMKLEDGIELAKRSLCQHLGIPWRPGISFLAPETPVAIIPVTDSSEKAVTRRTEYKLLNMSVEAALLDKRMARSEYMPQLSVSGMAFYLDLNKTSTTNLLGLVNLSIPLSDWWGGIHKIRQKSLELEKSKNNLQEKTELMTLQVQQASDEMKENVFESGVSAESVTQAEENLRITEDNYKAGISGMSDLLEARALLQKAKETLAESRNRLHVSIAKYKQATGNYQW
ncbi:MAG: efflux RND transporter permease subunit [Syntrophothermus sp.]